VNVVVSGEVNRPGSYQVGLLAGGGDNPGVQYPTVLGAITLAEGVTLAGDIRQVQLRRPQGLGPEQIINLDLTELVRTGNLPQDITLRDGDTIFVPTTTNVNLAEVRQFSTTSFAGDPKRPRTVTVVGEVNRPGSYVVVGGSATTQEDGADNRGGGDAGGGLPTVTRAIQLAGGITSSADIRSIQIRRPTKTGTEQTVNIDLWQLLHNGDTSQDTIVQDGDTVIIATATDLNPAEATELADANFSPATIQVSVVGEVKEPGVVNIPPNTPLNQALLTAGGFTNSRARKKDVELVRLNPDGTVTKRSVSIDLAQGISEKDNPTLRDNDVIVVNRNGIARIGDTLGTVLSPVTGIFSLFRIFGL
jgi:polysaccharide export outer membrane protein